MRLLLSLLVLAVLTEFSVSIFIRPRILGSTRTGKFNFKLSLVGS